MNCFEAAICDEIDKYFDDNNIKYDKKTTDFNTKFNQYMNVLTKRIKAKKEVFIFQKNYKINLLFQMKKKKTLLNFLKINLLKEKILQVI